MKMRGMVLMAAWLAAGAIATPLEYVNEGPCTVMLNNCHFSDWDIPGKGAPCIRIGNGRLILGQCEFARPVTGGLVVRKTAVSLEEGFIAGTVTGCLFHNDSITNTSAGNLELFANVFEPQDPSRYLGNRTLKELCAGYEVGVEDVVVLLKQHGIEAKPDSTFETIAKEAGLSPSELFVLVASNL